MECNRDEAKRAMDIAERKVTEKDYNGAKRFANKAKNLYPPLDGLKQVFMMIDVYTAAENMINGEADWYGILGVDPLADEHSVRSQYRKLAMLLHPDKNKCKGAEGAFKLVSEAWSCLSDKAKRSSYNQKIKIKEVQQRYPTQSKMPPNQPTYNGFQNVRDHVVSGASRGTSKPTSHVDSSSFVSPKHQVSTFWTICHKCKTQYEYQRLYLNHTLLCPNCRETFIATEKTPPPSVVRPVKAPINLQPQSSKNQATKKTAYGTYGRDSLQSASRCHPVDSSSRMASFNSRNATNQAQEKVKRGFAVSQERDDARKIANCPLRAENTYKKFRTNDSHMAGPYVHKWSDQSGVGMGTRLPTSDPGKENIELPKTMSSQYPYMHGFLLSSEIQKALVNKARSFVSKILQELNSETEEGKERKVKKRKTSTEVTSKISRNLDELEMNTDSTIAKEISHDSNAESNNETNTIVVPDSDFHNFDLDRSETSFKDEEIWAAYDEDGLPRFYARIQKVISLKPFKMKISWLSSRSNTEFGSIDWVSSGFAKSCGHFWTGRYELTNALNAFSHKVDFTKGARGVLHILPRKGHVWALYRNWSPDWDSDTPDEVINKYDMVEVLEDFTFDKESVTVTHLVKVEGFLTVFRRSTDQNDVKKIPKEEMFRFSHQVPHYILTGDEAGNALEGCLELDPAAATLESPLENAESKEEKMNQD